MVCVIDVQGAIAVRGRVPISLLIFLRPPSDESNSETQMLAQRLRQRAPLDDDELKLRLKTARLGIGANPIIRSRDYQRKTWKTLRVN